MSFTQKAVRKNLNLHELVNEFNEVTEYKIKMQKSTVLHTFCYIYSSYILIAGGYYKWYHFYILFYNCLLLVFRKSTPCFATCYYFTLKSIMPKTIHLPLPC